MVRLILAFAVAAALGWGASLDDAYHDMYNLQFDEAHRAIHEWEQTHLTSPLGPAADAAAYLFAEFERLHILQSEFFAEDSNFLNSISSHRTLDGSRISIRHWRKPKSWWQLLRPRIPMHSSPR